MQKKKRGTRLFFVHCNMLHQEVRNLFLPLLLTLSIPGTVHTQSLPVVYGDPQHIYVVDIPDVNVSASNWSGSSESYSLDIDYNGVADLYIRSQRAFSNSGVDYADVSIRTGDSLLFILNQEYIDSVWGYSSLTYYSYMDTFTVAGLFVAGDTLDTGSVFTAAQHYVVRWNNPYPGGGSPMAPYYNISLEPPQFHTDVYAGISKVYQNMRYYGWLRLSFGGYSDVTIREYAFNTPLLADQPAPSSFSYLIYPNPAHGQVQVISPEPLLSAELRSVTGQPLRKWTLPLASDQLLDISGIPDGVYFLLVNFSDKSDVQKLVIN